MVGLLTVHCIRGKQVGGAHAGLCAAGVGLMGEHTTSFYLYPRKPLGTFNVLFELHDGLLQYMTILTAKLILRRRD